VLTGGRLAPGGRERQQPAAEGPPRLAS
jgi:hypothetical protein